MNQIAPGEARILTVLLTTSIGHSNVAFQGPVNRSGPCTGQYWHPPSGSLTETLAPKCGDTSRIVLMNSAARTSAVGTSARDFDGGESMHATPRRARSKLGARSLKSKLNKSVPLPAIACEKAWAEVSQSMGISRNIRRRPKYPMSGPVSRDKKKNNTTRGSGGQESGSDTKWNRQRRNGKFIEEELEASFNFFVRFFCVLG